MTNIFEFDNFANSDKFKEFKYDYATKMSRVIDISNLENLIEGIKSSLYSSYEYINDGTMWIDIDGLEAKTDTFDVVIKPKPFVDNNKQYYTPDELQIEISYEEDYK